MKRRQFIKGSAIVGMSLVTAPLLAGNSGMFAGKGTRQVYRILKADRSLVGTLPVMRAFAGNHNDYVSPYVFFDEFGPVFVESGSKPLRVDAHPHAGVIPTTYFLEGSGHHKDSLNYDFQIGKGDFMIFSSGRGAIHMEETGKQLFDQGGRYHGFQIWLNMPSKYKFIEPTTAVHRTANMDVIETREYWIRVVLGELMQAKSSIDLLSPAFYYHVRMFDDSRLDIPTEPTHNAFIYLISGKLELEGGKTLEPNQVALYERGESLVNLYAQCGAEFLMLGGQPLDEVVYSYGPFVMNTEEQIRLCIQNYRSGMMGNPEIVNKS